MVKKRKQPKKVEIRFDTTLFDIEKTPRDQACKILEEAAETFSAVERFEIFRDDPSKRWDVLDEIADVIQAALNLAYKIEFDAFDIDEAMTLCEKKNKERGRC